MTKKTIIAAVIVLSLLIPPPLSVSAQSATLTIIQADPSEGVLLSAAESSYVVGDTVDLVIVSFNIEKQISSFRMTASDGAGVTTVTIVGHNQFIISNNGYSTYSFPMTAGGIVLDNITTGQTYPVSIPTTVANGLVRVRQGTTEFPVGRSTRFLINTPVQILFIPDAGYVFESAKNVLSFMTSIIDENNPNYSDGVYSFTVGASTYNITDVIFRPIPTYAITLPATVSHGGVVVSKTSGIEENENISLTFIPEYGYDFISAQIWYSMDIDKVISVWITPISDGYSAGSYTFSMPAADVTLSHVVFSTNQPTYAISLPISVPGGSVTADKLTGIVAGSQCTLTFSPNTDYEFISAEISYPDGSTTLTSTITPISAGYNAGSYTFTMPAADVTLSDVIFNFSSLQQVFLPFITRELTSADAFVP